MKVVFATNNPGKAVELIALSKSEGIELLTLSDLGLHLKPDETGKNFEENALIKATETSALLKESGRGDFVVLADDSGLSIDALDGQPGVDSSTFAGESTPSFMRNAKVLDMMENVPYHERSARFECVIACVLPDGKNFTEMGELEGVISREQKGTHGFAFDPIFYLPQYSKTVAEISAEEKNKISHRGQAMRKMLRRIKEENLI
jgi:XTP/dITP diphosphohydrolase